MKNEGKRLTPHQRRLERQAEGRISKLRLWALGITLTALLVVLYMEDYVDHKKVDVNGGGSVDLRSPWFFRLLGLDPDEVLDQSVQWANKYGCTTHVVVTSGQAIEKPGGVSEAQGARGHV